MQLMLLTSRTSCKSSTKRPKEFRSSSIWWKRHKPKKTEGIFQSRTSKSKLWPSRLSPHRINTRRIPVSGKNYRHKNKPGQSVIRSFVRRMMKINVVKNHEMPLIKLLVERLKPLPWKKVSQQDRMKLWIPWKATLTIFRRPPPTFLHNRGVRYQNFQRAWLSW